MEEVAATTLIAVLPTGEKQRVRIAVGRPTDTGKGAWACEVLGEPLIRFPDGGVDAEDALQALALAMTLTVGQLHEFVADGGQLLRDDGSDQEYPLDALFGAAGGEQHHQHDASLPHVAAHQHSSNHKAEIAGSSVCGCFHCMATFPPERITQWVDDTEGAGVTALCPECGIDSVIGDASGFPIQPMLLRRMNAYWFDA